MTQATRWPLPPRRSQWRSWQQNLSSQTILCNLDPVQSCAICTDQPQKPMVTSCTNTSQKELCQKDMAAHGHQGSPAEGGRFRTKVSDSEYFKVRSNMHKIPRVQHTRGIRSPKGTDKPRKYAALIGYHPKRRREAGAAASSSAVHRRGSPAICWETRAAGNAAAGARPWDVSPGQESYRAVPARPGGHSQR